MTLQQTPGDCGRQRDSLPRCKLLALYTQRSWTEPTEVQEPPSPCNTHIIPMGVILPSENHPLSPNCPHSDEAPMEARLIHANCIQLRLSLQRPDHKKSISATISLPQTSVTWGPLVFSSREVRCLPSLKSITFNLAVAKSHFGSSQTQRTDGPVTSTLRLLLLLTRNSGHEPHS